jgi:hypothetical protein
MKKFYWKYYGGGTLDFLLLWLGILALWAAGAIGLIGWMNGPAVIAYDRYGTPSALNIAEDSVQSSPDEALEGRIACIPPDKPGSLADCSGEIGTFLAQMHAAQYDTEGNLRPADERERSLHELDNILSRADPAPAPAPAPASPAGANQPAPAAAPAAAPFNWMQTYVCSIDSSWRSHREVVAAIAAAYPPCKSSYTDWTLVRYNTYVPTDWAIGLTWLFLIACPLLLLFCAFRSWKVRMAYRWLYHSPLP